MKRQNKKRKKRGFVRYIMAALLMSLFLGMALAPEGTLQAFEDYEVDDANNLHIKFQQKKASPTASIKYATDAWYIFQDRWKEEKFNEAISDEWEEDGYSIATSEGTETEPDKNGTYWETRKVSAEEIVPIVVEWFRNDREKLFRPVTLYARRTLVRVQNGEVTGGPYYNFTEFKEAAEWSSGTLRAVEKGYNTKLTLTFRHTPFEIQVEDNESGKLPDGYHYAYDSEDTLGGRVLYGETIGSIECPGEIDGYEYMGYEWRNSAGKRLAGGEGTYTEDYTVKLSKIGEGKGLVLVFLYRPVVPPTPVPTAVPVTAIPTPTPTPTPTLSPTETPVPTETPTPTPEGGITVTFDPNGGYVSPESKKVVYGQTYGQLPVPEKAGYEFQYWCYLEDGSAWAVTSMTYVLTDKDHTLLAVYLKLPEPDPGPTSTPTPIPTPVEDREYYYQKYHFYTTDKCDENNVYTLDAIANDTNNELAGVKNSVTGAYSATYNGEDIKSAAQTKRSKSYRIGKDALGNTWYFIADGENATYVHPAVYLVDGVGRDATTEDVKYITELVFPSTLDWAGTEYTVTSIGGGGFTYHSTDSKTAGNSNPKESYTYAPEQGTYSYKDEEKDSNGEVTYTAVHTVDYMYGVIGNGHIISYAKYDKFGSANYTFQDGANDYYVYNTTLKKVVIPSTVKEVLDGAFLYCQALEEIECSGVEIIGEHAFQAADILKAEISPERGSYYNGEGVHIYMYRLYEYNGHSSMTGKDEVMLAWEEVSPLVARADISPLTGIRTIKTFAFAYRDNLYDVVLGQNLALVETDAFYHSRLERVTVKGTAAVIDGEDLTESTKETLGTRGTVSPTLIYCEGSAAKVIRYGVEWTGYYILVCGHDVVYSPNGGRLSATGLEEDYVTKTQLQAVPPVFTEVIPVRNNGGEESHYLLLDVNGDVWYYFLEAEEEGRYPALRRYEPLDGYNITSIEEDKANRNYFFFTTAGGELYYTYLYPSGSGFQNYAPVKVCSTDETELSYNFGSETYIAYYKTNESSAAKKYYRAKASYNNTSKKIEISWSYNRNAPEGTVDTSGEDSSDDPDDGWSNISAGMSTAGTGEYAYMRADDPEGEEQYTTIALDKAYDGLKKVGTTGYGRTDGSYSVSYNCHWYFPEAEDGTEELVCFSIFHSYTASVGNNYGINATAVSLRYGPYTRAFQTADNAFYAYNEETAKWYYVHVSSALISTGTNTYQQEYSASERVLDRLDGLQGVQELWRGSGDRLGQYCVLLDTEGRIWYGTSPALLTKTELAQDIVEVRLFEDFIVLEGTDGRIYAKGYPEPVGKLFGQTEVLTEFTELTHLKEGVEDWTYAELGFHIKNDSIYSLATGEELFYAETSMDVSRAHLDCVVVDNVLYRLSTGRKVQALEDGYEWKEYCIISDGMVYDFATGNAIMEYKEPFMETVAIPGTFMNNGILYDGQTFEALPAVADTYKFIAVMEPGSIVERYGYDFRFWNTEADGSGTTYTPGSRIEQNADLKVYAQWKEGTNVIHFEKGADGVTGIMEDLVLPFTQTTSWLPLNQFEKEGYYFTGWGLAPDSEALFPDGACLGNIRGRVVLYAQWELKTIQYELVYMKYPYDTADNTVWKTKTLFYEQMERVEGAPYTSSGYTVSYSTNKTDDMSTTPEPLVLSDAYTKTEAPEFEKWRLYREEDGEKEYQGRSFTEGQVISRLTETDGTIFYLYPSWGGADTTVCLPIADCEGYRNLGWSEYKNGSGRIYYVGESDEGGLYSPVKDTLLYAVWLPEQKEVVLEGMDADQQLQTEAVFTFDSMAPKVTVPSKNQNTFGGYYTELDADGKPTEDSIQVIDKNGEGCLITNNRNHCFDEVDTLYAYWLPKELDSAQISIFSRDPAYVVDANLKDDPELPTFEWREYGNTMLEISVNTVGYFDYAVLQAPWELEERVFYWEDGTYDMATDTWVKDENIVFWRSQFEYPEDMEMVLEYPGFHDQTYTITVDFYVEDEVVKEYKLGLWMVCWDTWGAFIHPSVGEGHWDFNGDGEWDKYPFYNGDN